MSQLPSSALSSEYDPRQWSKWRRWVIILVIWNTIAPVDLSLTFYSGMQQQIQDDFHASNSLVTLGVGLYNFGAIFGPLVAGPLSEFRGRRPIYIFSMVGFTVFSLLTAISPSITWVLVCRAITGFVSSGIFAVYGGSLSDLFTPRERAPWVAVFTIMLQGAPTIGPVPSAYLGTFIHWRWLMGFTAIWGAVIAALVVLLPETEPSAIQRRLAKQQDTLITGISSPSTPKPLHVWKEALSTPATILRREPIVTWTTLYHSFIYGLLFLLLEAYPHVYRNLYSMSRNQAGLVFILPWIGNLLGVLIYFRFLKPQYEARQHAISVQSGGKREIPPEGRLPGVILASLFTPIGMFWFTFSARPDVHWFIPVLSGVPVGMGMTLIQLSLVNYYIDLYPTRSASVIAVNCAVRNIAATAFPSIGVPLYSSLGIHNASLLLACIGCIGLPTGLLLLFFGKTLRARSPWAKQDVMDVPETSSVGIAAPLLAQLPAKTYGGTTASTTN